MQAIKAIYDGDSFRPIDPVPVKGKYEVIITFINPMEKKQDNLLNYFNIGDEEDVKCIEEMINERNKFSLNRQEI